MDEGQCFRCGRVPRLCVCPEGVLETPPSRTADAAASRRILYESPRGFALAYSGTPGEQPVLTCELYSKWYALYLVERDGTVRQAPLDLDELEQYAEGASVVGDHCWNPYVVQRLADAKDWLVDDLSFDLLVGRWITTGHDCPGQTTGASVPPVIHVHDSIEVEGVPTLSEEEAAEVRKRMEDLCPRPFEYGRLPREADAEEPTSVQILRELHEAFENVIIQHETKSQRVARRRAQDFLEALDSPRPMPREAEAFVESPSRFKYRLRGIHQFWAQSTKAAERGIELHQALETLHRFGMEMMPVVYREKGKLPPRYGITGKKDEYYLEHHVEDSWEPFDSREAAEDEAWADFEAIYGGVTVIQPQSDDASAMKVHFALRLAKLQANYESNVDEDVTLFLERRGITDIYNVPKKWTEVTWRGKKYMLCELEDEEGIVTPFGLYLDWPAPTPDMKDDHGD